MKKSIITTKNLLKKLHLPSKWLNCLLKYRFQLEVLSNKKFTIGIRPKPLPNGKIGFGISKNYLVYHRAHTIIRSITYKTIKGGVKRGLKATKVPARYELDVNTLSPHNFAHFVAVLFLLWLDLCKPKSWKINSRNPKLRSKLARHILATIRLRAIANKHYNKYRALKKAGKAAAAKKALLKAKKTYKMSLPTSKGAANSIKSLGKQVYKGFLKHIQKGCKPE